MTRSERLESYFKNIFRKITNRKGISEEVDVMSDDLAAYDIAINDQIKKHQTLQMAVISYLNSKDALEHWDEDHMFLEPSERCQNDREEMKTNLSAAEESMRLATFRQHEHTSKSLHAIDFDRLSKEWPIILNDNKGKDRMTIWSPRDEDELADQDDDSGCPPFRFSDD